MPQTQAPNILRNGIQIVDPSTGKPTREFASYCDQIWRQIAPGTPIIPCVVDLTTNLITLTPKMHQEGGQSYLDHITFAGVASAGSTGAVTARVKSPTGYLKTVKVYKTNGAAQAGNTDIVAGSFYFFSFVQALDAGAGGLVLK